jgi:predicted glutamine amidotransferase
MLLIPAKVKIPDDDLLLECWHKNPDGAGLMYQLRDDLVVSKGHMTFDKFSRLLDAIRKQRDRIKDIAIHFRIATHGAINSRNCHPWKIKDDLYLMHNGVIQWCAGNKNVSDSKTLAGKLSSYNFHGNSLEILERAIGSYNKLIIMGKSETHILNENAGTWIDNVWYSNTHHVLPSNELIFGTYTNRLWEECR